MRPLNVSPRERALVLVMAAAVIAWGSLVWIGRPLWGRLRQLDQAAVASQQQLERLRELSQRRAEIERKARAYARFQSTMPEDSLQRQFLDELEQYARDANLQINLTPRPIQRERSMSRLGVEVDADATQETLLTFLDCLLRGPSLIEVSRVQMSAAFSKDFPIKASLLVHKIVVRQ